MNQSIRNKDDSDSGPEEVAVSRTEVIFNSNETIVNTTDTVNSVDENYENGEKKGRKRKRIRNKKSDKEEPVKKQNISRPKQYIAPKRLTLLQKVKIYFIKS